MIGYCGTGYHGMQINPPNKTIEEDLYKGFVDAGAISKDNASDLKKSAFMRAARTDKGVHAAGNVVSLKLIIEDPDIVTKINANLPDQIRVWGISRTNKSFECRKMCSSRIYEYLIPSYSFLPPKPVSALAERLVSANKKYPGIVRSDPEGEKFWSDIKKKLLDDGITEADIRRVQKVSEDNEYEQMKQNQQRIMNAREAKLKQQKEKKQPGSEKKSDDAEKTESTPSHDEKNEPSSVSSEKTDTKPNESEAVSEAVVEPTSEAGAEVKDKPKEEEKPEPPASASGLKFSEIVKKIKIAEHEARREYRISSERLDLIRQALKQYEGVHNFHNFTIGKTFKDPSAMRNMKTLTVSDPKIIENTEWLSIKIHGQSFMMHQIRKMIAMVALTVRCGTPITRITDAFGAPDLNIPKAPGLGLLLEQPVYDGYNSRLDALGYDHINFEKWKDEVEAFKFKHIYDKIYSEEDREHVFYKFFSFIDSFRGDSTFDYLGASLNDSDAVSNNKTQDKTEFVMEDDDEDNELPPDADTEG